VLHGQFAPEQLVRPPGTPWSNISGTHFHIAAERLVNFSGIPKELARLTEKIEDTEHNAVVSRKAIFQLINERYTAPA
jgi:hypothetical protein